MGAGMYRVRVVGELDSSGIIRELDRISKSYRLVVGGVKGTKGGALNMLGADAEKASKRLKGLNGQVIQTDKKLKGVKVTINGKPFRSVGVEAQASTSKLKGFGAETLNVTKKVIQFGAVTAVIRGVTSGLGDMVQKTFELDAALTEFRKVSDLSGKGLEKYTDQAFKMGRSVAKTGTEMIEAATEFRKSGFNDQDSLKLGKVAMMFSNIADSELSAGDAAGFITSQIKANFKDVSNNATKASQQIIDAINEVSNTQAVSSTDLSMAMSKVGSAMKVNNNTYAQSLGMVTAGTEIMHGQASKVGRGLRTIGANISKLQKDAKTLDVQTKDGIKTIDLWDKKTNQVKSTYEVFKEFAGVWDDMTPDQQQALSLQMAGKNQQEVFASVVGNWKNAEKAAETASKQIREGGSAANENAKYLQSMEGHLENLKSAWSRFANAMVKSSYLNKGMDILAKTLDFLASDAGQATIKLAGLLTILNLIAKAALGLKGLSLVTLFKGFTNFGKGAKGATDALKVMQGAQVGKMAGNFGNLARAFVGPAGLVAGIGLLSVALAEYVPIGERAADIKLGKELKEAQSDVEKTEKKYKSLRDELDKLHEKEEAGTLTDSEQNRLNILENQTKQYERQLELKKQIAGDNADEYYHTVDPDKLEGKGKEAYVKEMSVPGRTEEQALASIGINDKIALSLNNVRARADEVTKAQQKVTEAYEHYGKESSQYKNALEGLDKAQKEQGDSLSQLENKRKEAIEDYGSEEEANKKLGKSWKDLNKEIGALKALKALNFKEPSKDMKALKKNADSLGVAFTKSGKSIRSIDLKTFNRQMVEAGYNTEDTWNYLKALGKENPKMKVDIDGTKTAMEDLEFVDGKIQKIDKKKAVAKTEVQSDKAMKAAQGVSKQLDKVGKKNVKPQVTVKASKGKLPEVQQGIKSIKGKTVNVKANAKGKSGIDKLKSAIASLKGKTIDVITRKITKKSTVQEKHGVRHFAAGGNMVNAEVNEQGFEIIQDADTGLMRVVRGGKRGTTHLGDGDTVFTHGQSVRMLRNAGLTEGDVIYGHGDDDFGLFGIQKLRGFKKGKKKKKKSKKKSSKKSSGALTQKQYNSKYQAIQNAMNSGVATLEYNRDYYNWTSGEFAAEYKKLYDKQVAALASLNKSKVKKGVKKSSNLGTDIIRAYNLAQQAAKSEAAKENIQSLISNTQGTESDLTNMLNAINAADKAQLITADEAKEYRMQAYKQYVDYNLKQYQNDKETYAKSLALIKDYYAQGKLSGEDYYKYLEQLAKDQLEKEKKRLTEQQTQLTNTYDLAKAYVQRQIDLLKDENEEQDEQNQLVELQNNLAKARNQRIRVYKEGEGFVYEKDTEAIREATQALQDYAGSVTDSQIATNPILKQWESVLALFDDIEADNAIKRLENLVGSNVNTLFGGMGTDTNAWTNWIKNNLSTTGGIQDILNNLDKLVDTNDIINYLDSNGQVKDAVLQAAIANNVLPQTYAAAITQAAQSMSIAANAGASIATQGAIAAMTSGSIVSGSVTQNGNIYNFDSLVLPNVTNAQDFINELDNLPNMALQASTQRG